MKIIYCCNNIKINYKILNFNKIIAFIFPKIIKKTNNEIIKTRIQKQKKDKITKQRLQMRKNKQNNKKDNNKNNRSNKPPRIDIRPDQRHTVH